MRGARITTVFLVAVLGFLALCSVGLGDELHVPSQYGTIQAAIDAASEGDEIIVAIGNYPENINFKGKNITLTSTDPNNPDVAAATIIDGSQNGSVITFNGSEDANCLLKGFTITGGKVREIHHEGVGICGNGTGATILNCVITGNSAEAFTNGGGLAACNGLISYCIIRQNTCDSCGAGLYGCHGRISNCTITANTCRQYGGGLHNCGGEVRDCTITENSAGIGGGLYGCGGLITNCTISRNSADAAGGLYSCIGAISNCIITENKGRGLTSCGAVSNCTISGNTGGVNRCSSVSNCIITYNSCPYAGGGVSGCDFVSNCIISGNYAYSAGGGASACDLITNCTIVANSTGRNGGGIGNSSAVNCTISGNRANGDGGGLYFCGYDGTITNCIVWGNTATEGSEIYLDLYQPPSPPTLPPPPPVPSSIEVNYSSVQGGSGGIRLEPGCTVNWGKGNIEDDPLFVDPNAIDYHLKSQAGRWEPNSESWVRDDVTSPCIDAGNPGCPVGDEPLPNGNRRNMGAYGGTAEASKSPAYWRSIADMTNDWIVDSNDLKVFADYWLQMGECIPSDFDRSQFVDFNDFAILGGQWRQEGPGPTTSY